LQQIFAHWLKHVEEKAYTCEIMQNVCFDGRTTRTEARIWSDREKRNKEEPEM
jgi:hypothetical protein